MDVLHLYLSKVDSRQPNLQWGPHWLIVCWFVCYSLERLSAVLIVWMQQYLREKKPIPASVLLRWLPYIQFLHQLIARKNTISVSICIGIDTARANYLSIYSSDKILILNMDIIRWTMDIMELPAAVMACLNTLSAQSPATNTPFTLVVVEWGFTTKYLLLLLLQ